MEVALYDGQNTSAFAALEDIEQSFTQYGISLKKWTGFNLGNVKGLIFKLSAAPWQWTDWVVDQIEITGMNALINGNATVKLITGADEAALLVTPSEGGLLEIPGFSVDFPVGAVDAPQVFFVRKVHEIEDATPVQLEFMQLVAPVFEVLPSYEFTDLSYPLLIEEPILPKVRIYYDTVKFDALSIGLTESEKKRLLNLSNYVDFDDFSGYTVTGSQEGHNGEDNLKLVESEGYIETEIASFCYWTVIGHLSQQEQGRKLDDIINSYIPGFPEGNNGKHIYHCTESQANDCAFSPQHAQNIRVKIDFQECPVDEFWDVVFGGFECLRSTGAEPRPGDLLTKGQLIALTKYVFDEWIKASLNKLNIQLVESNENANIVLKGQEDLLHGK